MSLRSQILKGILEGCILAIIRRRSVYGYELAETLKRYGLVVSEGSIYPALMRLSKEGLIQGTMRKSPSGPNRKYYTLTEKGAEALNSFKHDWQDVMLSVERLLQEGQHDE
jgi:PadR family transcriptional regulator, regulatory protein PadR